MDTVEEQVVSGWTASSIAERLAISCAIFRKRLGAAEMAQIRAAGIRRVEISCGCARFHPANRGQIDELMRVCRNEDMRIVSFHTSDIPLSSEDPAARADAVQEALALFRVAAEMGAGVVTFHLRRNEATRRSIDELLLSAAEMPIVFGVENTGAIRVADAVRLVDEVGSDRFKMLLDIGHEKREGVNPCTQKESAAAMVAECGDRLCAVHLHETFPVKEKADHRPPLHENGIIEWSEVFSGLHRIGYEGLLVFEDGRGENPQEWIQYTGTFPERFVAKYAG
ncbi:MAG: sugar phosphate isomerase/epimerase [Kiritimatiellae bacterium]|nr:sugar phosphate isomerase/epimerase [Kiritimatiellia bacterium]